MRFITNIAAMNKLITVSDKFQTNYTFELSEPVGKHFSAEFIPQLTPRQMLELGVFGGEYFADKPSDIPRDWWKKAKLSAQYNAALNYFGVKASQPRSVWLQKGWINQEHDPRGWFQWYCRYYMGRRIPDYDAWQIGRWKNITRHVAQLQKACPIGDLNCRPAQRQALLHWAYDSRKL
jgi:hypothetical protein